MANKLLTVFQNLDRTINGTWDKAQTSHNNTYNMSDISDRKSHVIYKASSKEDYEKTKLEMQQNTYLKDRWVKANVDLTVQAFNGLNNIKLMYRDADLMDAFPEIGAALDTMAEESCVPNTHGQIITVHSKSDRVKNILEDLFINRLDIQVIAPMVIRAMCKYGNQFMLLNVDSKLGVMGWRQLPVYEVERLENGIANPYGGAGIGIDIARNNVNDKDLTTKFVWTNETNNRYPFRDWQIAHFRLITNQMYLPYGVSALNAGRRHFRMLSLMEDMMLIYRLERSVERRVYKIFVGAIDDADVQSYVEEIANNFKRTPIIDPMTGQIDLRKNILPVHKDTPIPLLDGRTITIEELAKEYEEGKENFVYSIQDNTHKIVAGRVAWCGKNYTADKLIKITLDDNSHMIMANEHEVIMRDGTKKRADELVVGDSLMPFYRKVDKESEKLFDRYEKIYNPNSGKYDFTHRVIAESIEKEDNTFNTVHHKDFNKYNNNPTNLMWMDYHAHHKMHGDMARNMWKNPEKRKSIISKLSQGAIGRAITDEVKEKISVKLKAKYASGELDWLKKENAERLRKYASSEIARRDDKLRGLKLGYRDDFRAYNESELHTIHNEIRRKSMINLWKNETRKKSAMHNMKVKFDDFVWNEIRLNILNGIITSQNKMIKYINSHLIDYLLTINSSKKLHNYKKVTKPLVRARIVEKGFENFEQFYISVKKNHKVKSIEYVGGDDVYCMTVVGLNGEDDRHNFALRTWNEDKTWNENGVFVSNCYDQDLFIPVRDASQASPIETLPAAQNLTAIDDIKFVQNKLLTALRIPKSFLNFEETTGDGKNLALMDIRFVRTVNRFQQAFLMEMTKIASIHLYLLGFTDDLTNFTLSMTNPSTQSEQLEIENIQKKVGIIRDAVSDPGNGISVMSLSRALKEIMKWSDKEIQENFEEIRLEKALATELEKTSQIIKKTGIFDNVDRIYGEPGAKYQDDQQQGNQDEMGGMMGGGGGGSLPPMDDGGFGSDVDELGEMGADENGEISGNEGEVPMGGEEGEGEQPPSNEQPPMENLISRKMKPLLNEIRKKDETSFIRTDVYDKSLMINEEFDKIISSIDGFLAEKKDKGKLND